MKSTPIHGNGSSDGDFADSLDAGLRAAFGPRSRLTGPRAADASRPSIFETLDIESRVLLHDDADGEASIINPPPAELSDARAGIGRYQIHGEIARGGVGVVLRGRDIDLGRDVAMKVLLADHQSRPAMVQRFMEEAQITGQLQHPGVLPVYELGLRDDRRPFFTMKLVRGRTLSALLQERTAPLDDLSRFLGIFEHICQTIAYAHSRGVVHRDLKPSNVMVGAFGEVQVLDWGLAKVIRTDPSDGSGPVSSAADTEMAPEPGEAIETVRSDSDIHSVAGSVMGTPAYMPPEQARGDIDEIDERCDVFSLGAILCEILTGAPPYGGTKAEVLRNAAAGRIETALDRLAKCRADGSLIAIAKKCLSPDKNDRPRSAGVVAKSIGDHIAGLAARARALELESAAARVRAEEERRARRLRTALATAVLFALMLIASGFLWNDYERRGRITTATRVVEEALGRTQQRLGEARASRIGIRTQWEAALMSANQLRTLLDGPEVADDARDRAREFLTELDRADADRRMTERIEEVVIVGATHQDADSWIWMDDQLIAAFKDYGIDLVGMPREEIARRIRESDISIQLCSGFELWIGTGADLMGRFGVPRYTVETLRERAGILELADPDPVRTTLRRMMFMFDPPDLKKLRELANSKSFDDAAPVTLSWFAMTVGMAGDNALMHELYQRALRTYPSDFMLNFDYALSLTYSKEWEKAIRYYMRCVAIRPDIGGVWRSLGIALRESGELTGAIDALNESIRRQPGHAATHVDLGISLTALERFDEAIAAFRDAIAINDRSAAAHGYLGVALMKSGRNDEALIQFKRCSQLAGRDTTWPLPVKEWIKECSGTSSDDTSNDIEDRAGSADAEPSNDD